MATKKQILNQIDVIEKKLPNGELKEIMDNTKEIRDYLIRFKEI